MKRFYVPAALVVIAVAQSAEAGWLDGYVSSPGATYQPASYSHVHAGGGCSSCGSTAHYGGGYDCNSCDHSCRSLWSAFCVPKAHCGIKRFRAFDSSCGCSAPKCFSIPSCGGCNPLKGLFHSRCAPACDTCGSHDCGGCQPACNSGCGLLGGLFNKRGCGLFGGLLNHGCGCDTGCDTGCNSGCSAGCDSCGGGHGVEYGTPVPHDLPLSPTPAGDAPLAPATPDAAPAPAPAPAAPEATGDDVTLGPTWDRAAQRSWLRPFNLNF